MTSPASSTSPRSAQITLHSAFHRGTIDRRLFGSFVEHMGRCLYSGVFEPAHPSADEWGFRTDVAELVGELGTTLVRYPGGNFVSGYAWEDGVGPVGERPQRLDLAWRSIESNRVGTDEFLPWARRLGLEPMMAVNLGTRGVPEAVSLVEYCNLVGGTAHSDLRRKNGHPQPHDVRLWCLGNEMDGSWQIGHKNADDYGKLAAEAGKAMRLVDPTIELVACGSSNREMATFGSWESTVLDHTWDVVDYVSMHAYYDGQQPRADFLASGWSMDRFVEDVIATADAVGAARGSAKKIKIAFDEWNVWSSRPDGPPGSRNEIEVEPIISEDPYQQLDAIVLGDLLISLLNHSDRVRVACLSLLVNVSAPITTERGGAATRQTIFHPMAITTRWAQGHSLLTMVDSPTVFSPRYGEVPALSVAATHAPEQATASIFLVNRSTTAVPTTVVLGDLTGAVITGSHVLTAPVDTDEQLHLSKHTDAPTPGPLAECVIVDGDLQVVLPPSSWAAVSLATRH